MAFVGGNIPSDFRIDYRGPHPWFPHEREQPYLDGGHSHMHHRTMCGGGSFLSNIITAIMIPVCFPLIDNSVDNTFMTAFLKILHEVCIVLIVPMLLAYIVKHHFKRFHRWVISVKDLSYYMWGCSLMIVTGTTVKNIVHANTTLTFLFTIAFMGLILCIIQFAVGRFIGHYFDTTIESGQALGQKNTAFAIWIAYTYLNPLSSVGPGCYILWQNIINSIEIWMYGKRNQQSLTR